MHMTSHDKKMMELIDSELKKSGISRRDALKIAGLSSAAFLFNPSELRAEGGATSDKSVRVVIVGGGLAGVSTAAKIGSNMPNAKITVIEPNEKSVVYQPGQTLVASGVWDRDDINYDTADYMPDGVEWIKDWAVEFDPENNNLTTLSGKKVEYDFLVVATGLVLDFAKIGGLEAVGDVFSTGDSTKAREILGKNGVASIYFADGAMDTWTQMQKFVDDAKSGKKVNGLFTDPATPIKCGGAPKKIMYLTNSRLVEAGARENATLTFNPNGGKMFGVPEYHEAILKQFEARDFKFNYAHNLKSVDLARKVAIFDHHWEEKGEYDKDLEEYAMVEKHEDKEFAYDFLHITPPQKAPDVIAKSPLGSAKGWVPVNEETLQHVKYKNVFSLGDVAAVPLGKTGGTVRKQYKVVTENIIAAAEGKELTSKFNGYTVCPLITDIGTVMLAEFDYTKKPTPSFPLDPTQERWIWWILKAYLLKPMTVYGMLKGRA